MRMLIVEDEPLIAQRLEVLCREILGGRLRTVRVTDSFERAAAWLAANPVDTLLLDLNLRGVDGMELLRRGVAGSFHTIIVSGSTERAVEAFEHGALDFVPKPFTRERLARALTRVGEGGGRAARVARSLAVRKRGRIELIAADDVLYVEGAGNYTELVLADGRRELHDKTLTELAAILSGDFERIHKSYLVRLSAVRALHVQAGSYYLAELKSGQRLPVGRTRYKELREKFG